MNSYRWLLSQHCNPSSSKTLSASCCYDKNSGLPCRNWFCIRTATFTPFWERERDIIACFFKFRHLIFNDHVCKTHKRSVYISEGKRHLFSSLLHTVSTLFPALLSPALRYILITICYSAVQTLNTDVSCSTREFPESALFVIICKNHERERQGEKDTVEKTSHKTQQNTIWPYITIYRTTEYLTSTKLLR